MPGLLHVLAVLGVCGGEGFVYVCMKNASHLGLSTNAFEVFFIKKYAASCFMCMYNLGATPAMGP